MTHSPGSHFRKTHVSRFDLLNILREFPHLLLVVVKEMHNGPGLLQRYSGYLDSPENHHVASQKRKTNRHKIHHT